jgi:metallo-beta-lactamase family protein
MKITFYGAAGEVTGSKHVVEVGGKRVLLDCGTFQGKRSEALALNAALPVELSSVDAVVLSHAHQDHCGLLPVLVKRGYKGKIFSTKSTRDIVELMLTDSAHIQQQDYEYLQRHHIKLAEPSGPLYLDEDVAPTLARFQDVPYQHSQPGWTTIVPGVRLKLYEAGHILGSAVTVLEFDGSKSIERVAYTGDLGRPHTPLLKDPDFILDEVPTLLSESTYGNRTHQPVQEAMGRLKEVIHRTVARRGKIIVPAFALGRTQELIYILHQLTDAQEIPRLPIYVDSPLAVNVSDVFSRHRDDYDLQTWHDFSRLGEVPLAFSNLTYTRSVQESKDLNRKPGPFMVISASGMCEAGRVRHHLANGIEDPRNVIMITGFMAQHTIGRRLVEGEAVIKIFERRYRVRAEVVVFNEFSAHGDAVDLQNYAARVPGLERVFLVHGEIDQATGLQQRLLTSHPSWQVTIPQRGASVVV